MFANTTSSGSPRPSQVFAWFACYYLLHAIARIASGGSLQLDEAETLLLTQEWRWGYGSQGPLYTWLQKLVFLPFGPGLVGIALLKNVLLFLTPTFIYLAGREVFREDRLAALAACSLVFILHFSWESQRDQSHLVLATACASAAWWLHLKLLRSRAPRWYALFGLAIGCGLMAKYNFVVLPIGMLLACLFSREGREVWLNRRALIALLVVLVVTLPHLSWMASHQAILTSQSHKLDAVNDSAWFGLFDLGKALGEFLLMPALYGAIFWKLRPVSRAGRTDRVLAAWITGTLTAGIVVTAVIVAGFDISNLKSRWLQPLFIILPVPVLYVWQYRINERRARNLLAATLVAGLAILIGLHGRNFTGRWTGKSSNINIDFGQLADQMRDRGFTGGILIAEDLRVVGNLLRAFPASHAVVPTLEGFVEDWNRPTVVVWNASSREDPRDQLGDFVSRLRQDWREHGEPIHIEAPGLRGDPRVTRLGLLLLPPP